MDIPEMVGLARAMAAESPRYRRYSFSTRKMENLLNYLLDNPGEGIAFVAEQGGCVVGMVGGFATEAFFSTDRYVTDLGLYVSPKHRGGATALRLIKSFEAWAQTTGSIDILLGISTEVMTDRTVRMYERLGYRMSSSSLLKPMEKA